MDLREAYAMVSPTLVGSQNCPFYTFTINLLESLGQTL